MKNKTILYLILFLGITFSFTSCSSDDEDCPDEQVPYLLLSFEQSVDQDIVAAYIYNKQLSDSIYKSTSKPDSVQIPLKLSADTTFINFDVKYTDTTNTLKDVIAFVHTHTIFSEDIECGFTTVFYLNEILASTNFVDSIYIMDTIINSDEIVHAKVYY